MWESPSSSTGLEHWARETRFISLARTTIKKIHMLPRVLLNVGSPHEDARGNEKSTMRPQRGPTVPLFRSYGFVCFKSTLGKLSCGYTLDGNTGWSWHWECETAPPRSAEPARALLS